MTDHYYTDKPISKDNMFRYTVNIDEVQFQFFSNSGVFSKKGIDFGSMLLMDTVLEDADMIESGLSSEEKPSLADLGCGIGVIGIVLNRLLKINNTYLYDINERAVALAKMNINNNASKRTSAIKKDLINEQISERVDICVTNPPVRAGKKTVFAFYERAYEILNKNGTFYCVIQKKQGAESTKNKLAELFGNSNIIQRSAGYHIYKCIKNCD